MIIRDFIPGEEAALREVFMSSVHGLAARSYAREQLEAWAPANHDARLWAARIGALRPFVAIADGRHAGYADLQHDGHIDHFFVAREFAGQGAGSALMRRIVEAAGERGIPGLSAHVSLAAEAFFLRQGFRVVRRQTVALGGVSLRNAVMARRLAGMD